MRYQVLVEHGKLDQLVGTLPVAPVSSTRHVPGFVLQDPPTQLVAALRRNPNVRAVCTEGDGVTTPQGTVIRENSGWALSEVSRTPSTDNTGCYEYGSDGGGVWVYVFDRVPWIYHPEFATSLFDWLPTSDNISNDHATAVASVAAGRTCGVAPRAHIGIVGYPGDSVVLWTEAVDAIIAHYTSHADPGVVVIPLLWTAAEATLTTIDETMSDLIAAGLLPVCAAGNTQEEVWKSPARYSGVLTVGGFLRDGFVETGSYGSAVDVFAAYDDIRIAEIPDYERHGRNDRYAWWPGYDVSGGTSYSASIAAGVCALIWENDPSLTPAQLKQAVIDAADTTDTIAGLHAGSPNRMLRVPLSARTGKVRSRMQSTTLIVGERQRVRTQTAAAAVTAASGWADQDGGTTGLHAVFGDGEWDTDTYLIGIPVSDVTGMPLADPTADGGSGGGAGAGDSTNTGADAVEEGGMTDG